MTTKANCILLNVRGKQYYAEEFGKFIEIEEWEYDPRYWARPDESFCDLQRRSPTSQA